MSKPLALLNMQLPPYIEEQFLPHCEFQPWSLLDEGTPEQLAKIQALVIYGHPHISDPILDKLPNLKVISNFGVGVDHIDIVACTRHGVPVGNTPGAVDGATADMTMALLLAAARNVVTGDKHARSPGWTKFNPSELLGKEVYGSTLGIIGLGGVGKQVAKRACAFDMNVFYHKRNRDQATEQELGVEYTDLNTLLSNSDYVSINVPLTPETRNLIGAEELKKMRSDAILINIARGGVLDHDALYQALNEGWIKAAALDVTEPEPLPRDHPLLGLENIIITPHLGSATDKTRRWMGRMMVENMVAGLKREAFPHQVKG